MDTLQPSRISPLTRARRAFFGAIAGAAVGVLAATLISAMNGTSVAWALGLMVLFYGAPVAIVVGMLVGAFWKPAVKPDLSPGVLPADPARRLRNAPAAAWLLGIVGGLLAFVALLAMAATGLKLLGVFIGMLFPRVTQAIARLAMLAVIWASVRAGVRVIRAVDRRIHTREVRAT